MNDDATLERQAENAKFCQGVIALWQLGSDTWEIARALQTSEATVCRVPRAACVARSAGAAEGDGVTRWGTKMRRVSVPGCPITLRPADAAVYYAAMGYPPRSIVKLMRGAITVGCARQAISLARARGEKLPSFKAVPDVVGRLAKLPVSSAASGQGADRGRAAGE